MSNLCKKLLIISEFPPNASGGGPAVVRQMLRDWPAKDLFWWSCVPEADRRFGQSVSQAYCARIPRKLFPQKRLAIFKSALLEWTWAPYARAHLKRTIRQMQPDAAWVIPHNWSILPAARALRKSRIGFHVSMHDYVDVHGQPAKFGVARCRRMAELADRLYASATSRDAISQSMAADLEARTRAEATQITRAGLEVGDMRSLNTKMDNSASTIRIAYAGTILVPQAFALFAKALDQVRHELPKPVSLEFFGSHSYRGETWFQESWMLEHGNLPEPQLLAALRTCTWGFAPMSLTDDDPRYNRFSLPTKFITYLAAGLPVITLGHPQSSVMQMASRYSVGFSSHAVELESLTRELRDELALDDPWQKYGTEMVRCAKVEFDAVQMRAGLYKCFEDCAEITRAQRSFRSLRN